MVILEGGTTGHFEAESLTAIRETGHYDGHMGFIDAYFHTAEELRSELETAGLQGVEVFGVEGPTWPALDMAEDFDARVDAALSCARMLEQDPAMINASAHFLAIATNATA
jgi:hypothetical protein